MAILDVALDVLRADPEGSQEEQRLPALLVVDMQQGYVRGECETIVSGVAALAKTWSDRGQLVFLTKRTVGAGSIDEGLVGGLEELSGYLVHVLERSCWSAVNEELTTYLGLYGVEAVKVCGVDTERGVLASAVALYDSGFETTVLASLCASSEGLEMHQSGLKVLARILGPQRVVFTEGD